MGEYSLPARLRAEWFTSMTCQIMKLPTVILGPKGLLDTHLLLISK